MTLDLAALERWFATHLPDYAGDLTVEQFVGGQSNPTFRLRSRGGDLVLRKKPPGELLPSAHAIDREYRVMAALAGSGVPVPRMLAYCDDATVLGTDFFVMEFLPGRVHADPRLPGMSPAERAAIYDAMNAALAALHSVDLAAAGLGDYGRPENYCARQVGRWTRQYRSSETHTIAPMEALIEWLPRHLPPDPAPSLVHGDYRLENLLIDPHQPRVTGVLDWELSTVGDPFADLAHNCMPYRLPGHAFGGFLGSDLAALGIPSEAEYLAAYCRRRGLAEVPHWPFYCAFALFRMTAILQGVYARSLQGKGSSPDGLERGATAVIFAEAGLALTGLAE